MPEEQDPLARRAQILQHDINNHFQVIDANIDLVKMTSRGDEALLRRLGRIKTAADSTSGAVRAFLNQLRGKT